MILSIFRTNQQFTGILLIFYIALLHVSPFLISDNWEPSSIGIWASWIYSFVGEQELWSQMIAGFCLLIQAFLIIRIDIQHKLSQETTLFTGVFLILGSSLALPLLRLSPIYFSNIFLLLAINEILLTYRKTDVEGKLVNAGFFIGIASLFSPTYLIYIFWIFIALNLLRGFSFKERAMVIAGSFSVYLMTWTWFFWNKDLGRLLSVQFWDAYSFWNFQAGNIYTYIHLGLMMAIVLLLVLWRGQMVSKKVMQAQRKIDIFYWGLLFSLIVVLVQAEIQEDHLLAIMPFVGLFMGMQLGRIKPNIAELLHFLMLALVLFLQFRPLFLP